MAYSDFTLRDVVDRFGLTLIEVPDLFGNVAEIEPGPLLCAMLPEFLPLALAINTEKARSEFVIAPVLFELRRLHAGEISLFSGVELEADVSRGLNGICDFIVSRSPRQHVLGPPLITIVEAKNDNLRSGLGQCIAAMVAAQIINQTAGAAVATVHGAVTTGTAWKFLVLQGLTITLDLVEYHIEGVEKIMGILDRMVKSP